MIGILPKPLVGRVTEVGRCWEWQGWTNPSGYGVVTRSRDNRKFYVHRLAWAEVNGPIPPGACVLHSCDNRRCVRPSHLHLGTRQQNTAEMLARGRSGRGETHSQAKVTEQQVREIRAAAEAGTTHERIGQRFGISRSAVGFICQRRTWRHVA